MELAKDRLFATLPEYQLSDVFPEMLKSPRAKEANLSTSSYVEKVVEAARMRGDRILSLNDAEYPEVLRASPTPAPILFVRGRVESLRKPTVAVIGTRSPTMAGTETAKRITRWFVERHWTVVSGLALGIDSTAHTTCTELNSETVAVLAHGLDTLHPRSNAWLADAILDKGGCLLTEYSYGVAPFPGNFVERDSIQAYLSLGVVLIQSGLTGGSLHASRAIIKANRYLLVAAPSRNDRSNNEPKAQANVQLVDGGAAAAMSILKIELAGVEKVVPLHGRENLQKCEDLLLHTLHQIRQSKMDKTGRP